LINKPNKLYIFIIILYRYILFKVIYSVEYSLYFFLLLFTIFSYFELDLYRKIKE
jgi:positive regulator of sigma E activity